MAIPTAEIFTSKSGVEYRVHPLGVGDLLEEASFLRDEHLNEAKRQMVGLPVEVANHAWTEARKEAKELQVGTDAFKNGCLSTTGLIHVLYLAIRAEHRDFTKRQSGQLFDEDYDAAWRVAAIATGYYVRPTMPGTVTTQPPANQTESH